MALTPKQQLFVAEYLVDLNATQAAIRAGYSPKTSEQQGSRLLSNAKVQEAIQTARNDRSSRLQVTADRVLEEYAKIAFFDPRRLYDSKGQPIDLRSLDDDTAAAIVGLEITEEFAGEEEELRAIIVKKYRLADKVRALDSIARHLGMFQDKLQIGGHVTIRKLEDLMP